MAYKPTKVLLGFEENYGETPASPKPYKVCVPKNGLTYEQETEVRDCMSGDIDSGGEPIVTGSKIEGQLESDLMWEQFGVYQKLLFGQQSTVDNGDGTYTHTNDSTPSTHPSAYIQNTIVGATEYVEIFNGVVAKDFEVNFEGKGVPQITSNLAGSTFKDSITGGATAIDETDMIVLDSKKMNNSYTYIKIDDAEHCKLSKFSIKGDFGLETLDLLCDKKDNDITKIEITGDIEAVMDVDLYTKIANNQVVKIEIGYETTINGKNYKLTFLFNEVEFAFKTQPKEVGKRVDISTTWTAIRTPASTQKMKIELTNTTASYAA